MYVGMCDVYIFMILDPVHVCMMHGCMMNVSMMRFFFLPTKEPTDKAQYMYDVCMIQERVMLVSMFV